MGKVIPIVYCFDESYAPYAAVSTYSLISNSDSELSIYWIVGRENVKLAKELAKNFLKYNMLINIVGVKASDYVVGRGEHMYISPATYLRLSIPDVIKEEKVVYLDCDTLILSDLMDFYNTEMCKEVICGAIDLGRGWGSRIPLKDGDPFLNSGVMLMNLIVMKKDNVLSACKNIYKNHHDDITGMDQCVINKYAEGRKIAVDKKWNSQILSNQNAYTEFKDLENKMVDNIRIAHFVGFVKPWNDCCNPFIYNYWWNYANCLKNISIKKTKIKSIRDAEILLNWIFKNIGSFPLIYIRPRILIDLLVVVITKVPKRVLGKIFNRKLRA